MKARMIKELDIYNFRGVASGSLKLNKFTVLVGPNNSGKTTVLEALMLAHGIDNRILGSVRMHDLLAEAHRTLEGSGHTYLLFHLLRGYSGYATVRYSLNEKDLAVVISREQDRMYFTYAEARRLAEEGLVEEEAGPLKLKEGVTLGSLARCGQQMHYGIGLTYTAGSAPTWVKTLAYIPKFIERYIDEMFRSWIDFASARTGRRAAEWVSQISGEEYMDVLAEPFFGGARTLFLYKRDGTRVRLGDVGSGVEGLVTARMLVDYLKPELLLWDDIEAHMNPAALALLAEWLADLVDGGVQVVASTHSLEAAMALAGVAGGLTIVKLDLLDGELRARYYRAGEAEELKKLGIDVRV